MKSIAGLLVANLSLAAIAAEEIPIADPRDDTGWHSFVTAQPGTARLLTHGRVSRIFGEQFSTGATPVESANSFVTTHAQEIWGVLPEQLLPIGPFADQSHVLPLMTDPETGWAKFFLVAFTPHVNGVRVHDAALRLLVRNEPGFPLVLASAQLPDIEGFEVPDGMQPTVFNEDTISREAIRQFNFAKGAQISGIRPTIFAGINGESKPPKLTAEFILTGNNAGDGGYAKRRFFVDPETGRVVHDENMILHADVEVQVLGNVTDGNGAAECHDVDLKPIPYARVQAGGQEYIAAANGVVTIPNFGNNSVLVEGECRTKWFNVNNVAGSDLSASVTIESGGNGALVLNQQGSDELVQAQADVLYYAEEVRRFTLDYSLAFPTIGNQENFTCNANIESTCNAYYDGASINFYQAGGACNNTGFGTVVHHEYGHHLVNVAGSGQGEYGEGAGDIMGVLISGDSRLAAGFYAGDCNNGLRNADNNCQYSASSCSSCGSQIHSCGQLISGMIWDVREEFISSGISEQVLNSIFINSILVHNGSSIDEQIVIDWLTLDDDDSSIFNGTPHYGLINNGCSLHGLPAPEVLLAEIRFLEGLPEFVDPVYGAEFTVWINEYAGQVVEDSQRIVWRVDGGEWNSDPLEYALGVRWDAHLPPAPCDSVYEYYIELDIVNNGSLSSPESAPASFYTAPVATKSVVTFSDNGETDDDWIVIDDCNDGEWTRGNPVGGGDRGDPATDYDGSGSCWLTDNVDGNTDVDGGTTTLISPQIDASNVGTKISYARWYYNCGGPGSDQEVFTVDVSDDDGNTWTNLEVVGPQNDETCGGWFEVSFFVGDYVDNTDSFRIRFIAADDVGQQTLVEAAIDAIIVSATECNEDPGILGDMNNDGLVNGTDLGLFLALWGNFGGPADFNDDGEVTGGDLGILIANWTG